ncbi:hypothetical protein Q2E61_09250 [Microbulbifer thermotolerans]|uniref:hypothetical protein n=1 Tax=Microbulbifer thermotolerans TaxID=252514 RepID=UPI002671EA3C|nr:hypothetical protein [Microbulbifer thermotolerans]WKT59113.1 hypothetical protein Q2E61_09250 [Microbulbifer thermotolerans]
MQQVEALCGFEHGGSRKAGDKFGVTKRVAEQLASKGLVRVVGADPEKAAGTKSSASPAAQASQQTTAKKSNGGDQQKGSSAQ